MSTLNTTVNKEISKKITEIRESERNKLLCVSSCVYICVCLYTYHVCVYIYVCIVLLIKFYMSNSYTSKKHVVIGRGLTASCPSFPTPFSLLCSVLRTQLDMIWFLPKSLYKWKNWCLNKWSDLTKGIHATESSSWNRDLLLQL